MSIITHAETCSCETCIRTAAFGAIRRAARIARDVEESPLSWMDDPPNESYAMGRGIRIAIRAAIGSDKT